VPKLIDNLDQVADSLCTIIINDHINMFDVLAQTKAMHAKQVWFFSSCPQIEVLIEQAKKPNQQDFLKILIDFFQNKKWDLEQAEHVCLMRTLVAKHPHYKAEQQNDFSLNLVQRLNELLVEKMKFILNAKERELKEQAELERIKLARKNELSALIPINNNKTKKQGLEQAFSELKIKDEMTIKEIKLQNTVELGKNKKNYDETKKMLSDLFSKRGDKKAINKINEIKENNKEIKTMKC